jgi:hypothetical protein
MIHLWKWPRLKVNRRVSLIKHIDISLEAYVSTSTYEFCIFTSTTIHWNDCAEATGFVHFAWSS